MKKLLFLSILISLLTSACDSSDEIRLEDSALTPETRGFDRIISIATKAADELYPTASRGAGHHVQSGEIAAITAPSSRSEANDTLIYVVNFDGDNGYVMLSSDDTENEVLAVVEKGHYDPAKGTENPGLKLFVEAASNYVQDKPKSSKPEIGDSLIPIDPDIINHPKYKTIRDTIALYHCPPQVPQQWGQDGIYGAYCPNGFTGCVPLATGTIMTFFGCRENLQTRMVYTFAGATPSVEYIDWTELYRHRRVYKDGTEFCYAEDKSNSHKMLGRLLYQLGLFEGADYVTYTGGTAVDMCEIPLVIKTLKKIPSWTNCKQFNDFRLKIRYAKTRSRFTFCHWYKHNDKWSSFKTCLGS